LQKLRAVDQQVARASVQGDELLDRIGDRHAGDQPDAGLNPPHENPRRADFGKIGLLFTDADFGKIGLHLAAFSLASAFWGRDMSQGSD
jgi:hypothetical protein